MEWLTENWQSLVQIVVSLVGIAAIVASMTPNENDNVVIQKILDIINKLGFNVNKAKNDPNV